MFRSIDILDKKEYNYLYKVGKIVQAPNRILYLMRMTLTLQKSLSEGNIEHRPPCLPMFECYNRMFRRFIPKGKSIDDYSADDISTRSNIILLANRYFSVNYCNFRKNFLKIFLFGF